MGGRKVAASIQTIIFIRVVSSTNSISIPIEQIIVSPERRTASPEDVRKLADSISEIGLINPITVDRDYHLIAGLHRLEAMKLLKWTEITCIVLDLDGMQAQLVEIDENFVRCNLSAIEHGDLLLRRKEIYEALHPETKHGGDHMHTKEVEKSKTSKCRFAFAKPFAEDTAEKLGIGRRTVERQVQMAKNLTEEAKKLIRDTDTKITKKCALKLSTLPQEQQLEAAGMLSRGEIQSVDEYLIQRETPAGTDVSESDTGQGGEVLASFQRDEKPDQTLDPDGEADSDGQGGGGFAPFQMDSRPYTSFEESVAELKDPNRDRSCTVDSFLAEITSFVRKFHKEIEWYDNPYYEAVYQTITPVQLAYLREQLNLICSAADRLYNTVERIARQ